MKKLLFMGLFLVAIVGTVSSQIRYENVYWNDLTIDQIKEKGTGRTTFEVPAAGKTYEISYTPAPKYTGQNFYHFMNHVMPNSFSAISDLAEITNVTLDTITIRFKPRTKYYDFINIAVIGNGWYMEFYQYTHSK